MNLKKNSFLLIALIYMTSCSTLPSGEKKLSQMVEEDQRNTSLTSSQNQMYKGRPIFIKVHAYPQMLSNGDLFLGGDYLLSTGREDLTIEELLK